MYEFCEAAFPWIALGVFVAISCSFFQNKKK